MHRIALRGVIAVIVAAVLVLLAGCAGPVVRVKVVNEGDFPLTAVRFIPFMADAEAQEQAFADSVNLMPKDAENATIPLGVGKAALLPHLIEADLYYVSVTFYVQGVFYDFVHGDLLQLTDMENNALLTLWARCEYPEIATEPTCSLFFEW